MEQNEFQYNFVICGASSSYFKAMYKDVSALDNVCFYSSPVDFIKNPLLRAIFKLAFSEKVNKCIRLLLLRLISPLLYKPLFFKKDDKPICFLFFGNSTFLMKTKYMDYLTKKYRRSKKVLFMQDLVSRNRYFDIDCVRKSMDLILSYDKGDCQKYGFIYHTTPLSIINTSSKDALFSDVYFCGVAKSSERVENILAVYKRCVNLDMKCLFYIVDAPLSARIEGEGLIYDQKISYEQNIINVKNTKCILEVMQNNATGPSLRLWESILYSKHLLTNNSSLAKSNYYNPEYMHIFNDGYFDLVYNFNTEVRYSSDIISKISPINLLSFLNEHLLQ